MEPNHEHSILDSANPARPAHRRRRGVEVFPYAGQTMPSLKAIPQGVWLGMSVVELLCSLCLILPVFNKSLGILAPIAAAIIVLEMLVFAACISLPVTRTAVL
jgi:hypothetical protein